MKNNRIQIDGVWYVKEEQAQTKEIEIDPCWFEGCVVENDEVVFEATRIFKEENVPYPDSVNIEFTDKRSGNRKDWKVDNWDNNSWMVGIMENNADSMEELPNIGKNNTLFLQEFLKLLRNKSWI